MEFAEAVERYVEWSHGDDSPREEFSQWGTIQGGEIGWILGTAKGPIAFVTEDGGVAMLDPVDELLWKLSIIHSRIHRLEEEVFAEV